MVIKQGFLQVSNIYLFTIFANLILLAAPSLNSNADAAMTTKKLVSVDFEVFGKVQGVFFRKYTQQEANKLNVKGWCMNTERGTVQGSVQGDFDKVNEMKHWLQYTGSRASRIDKTIFNNEKDLKKLEYNKFDIRR